MKTYKMADDVIESLVEVIGDHDGALLGVSAGEFAKVQQGILQLRLVCGKYVLVVLECGLAELAHLLVSNGHGVYRILKKKRGITRLRASNSPTAFKPQLCED